ncbi:MAG: type II toxin-antitoxin system VapC family toxin [Microbacteriaceae bacterium]|nr:type II toxin-antitoxin system VapC family toxin [Microbacteriaceae bacterium]
MRRRVLLDTHALVWALTAPERLGSNAQALLDEQDIDVLVSAVSAWEIATKVRLGKMPEALPITHHFDQALEDLRAVSLPLSTAQGLLAGGLAWEHRDPFDRMLAAQAILEGVTLLTADAHLRQLPGLATVW